MLKDLMRISRTCRATHNTLHKECGDPAVMKMILEQTHKLPWCILDESGLFTTYLLGAPTKYDDETAFCLAYVVNHACESCSEFGDVLIRGCDGVIVRVG